MGPRPIRRGNDYEVEYVDDLAMLQWGHVQSDVETAVSTAHCSGLICFNGATSNQTWKRDMQRVSSLVGRTLQWGHVQSDVETLKSQRRCIVSYRFNGATSNQTWKRIDGDSVFYP